MSPDELGRAGGHSAAAAAAAAGVGGLGAGEVGAEGVGSAQKYRFYRQRAKRRQQEMEEELAHLREETTTLRERENKLLYLVLMSRNRDRQLEAVERQRDELLARFQYDSECALAIRALATQVQLAVAARSSAAPAGAGGAPANAGTITLETASGAVARSGNDEFLAEQATQPATQGAGDTRSSQVDVGGGASGGPHAGRDPPSPAGSASFTRGAWPGSLFGSFLSGAGGGAGTAAPGGRGLAHLQSPYGSLLGGSGGATAAAAAAVDQTISGDMFPQMRDSMLKAMIAAEHDGTARFPAGLGALVPAPADDGGSSGHERPEDALMTLARSGAGAVVGTSTGTSTTHTTTAGPGRSVSPSDAAAAAMVVAAAAAAGGADAEPPLHAAHGFASRYRAASPAGSPTTSPHRPAGWSVGEQRR